MGHWFMSQCYRSWLCGKRSTLMVGPNPHTALCSDFAGGREAQELWRLNKHAQGTTQGCTSCPCRGQFKSLHSQCPTTIDVSLLSARGQTLDTQDGRQTASGSVSAPSKVKGHRAAILGKLLETSVSGHLPEPQLFSMHLRCLHRLYSLHT